MRIEIREAIKKYLERYFWGYEVIFHDTYEDYVRTKGFFKVIELFRIPKEQFNWTAGSQQYFIRNREYEEIYYWYKNDEYKIILFR